jgi:signal peptidase II
VKLRNTFLFILAIIVIDQGLKIWIKTSFTFGPVMDVMGLSWFKLYFIENEGMAWGWKFGGDWGKVALTLFRLVAVIWGTWYIANIVKEKYKTGFIICASMIYAGALGNLIDSLFYGMIFEESTYYQIANAFTGKGYAGFLHGHVVDMLYFPIIRSNYPDWFPFVGGSSFEFFSPIFNIADASISIGIITLLLFQKKLYKKKEEEIEFHTIETNSKVSDDFQIT